MGKLELLKKNLSEIQSDLEEFEINLQSKDAIDAVKLLGDYNEKVFVPFTNLLMEIGLNEKEEPDLADEAFKE